MTSSCSSPYASSLETTNYARICRIVVDVLRDILWQVLTHAIPPADLPKKVQTDKKKLGNLDEEIKTWLYGISSSSSEIPSAEKFDVSSLYTLIRNLCGKVPAPSTQWGQIPPPTGTTLGDDIERVRAFRNSFYGHAKQAKVETTYFNNQCKYIKTVVSRFDLYFGSYCKVMKCDFKSEIDTILTCSMDKSLEDDYIDKMKQIAILSDDLKQEVSEVKQQVGEVKQQVDDVKKSLEIFQNTVDVFQKGSMEKAEDSRNCLCKIQETLEKIVMEKEKDKVEGVNGSLINKEQVSQLEKENAGISHEPSQSTKQKAEKRKMEDRELGSAPTWNFKLEDIRKVWQSIEGVLPEELSPKYLLDVFIEEGILSPDECQDLRKKKRREMSKELLQTVKDNLPDAFLVLLKALKKDGEDKVIDMLTKIIDGNNVVEGTAPVTEMSCYSVELSLKKYGKTVLRAEQAITDTLKNAAGGLIDDLCAVLNDVKSGSVIIHLQPLSKHARETLKLFCQHGRMKTFVLGLLKKRNIFATLPAGIICIDVQVCCQREDHSEGAYDHQRDLIPEQFEVLSYPQVIKVNLLLHYGSLLEEIEPIHLKKTFIDRGILVESFFQELKMLRRRERVCLFLNKILDIGSEEVLLALVDALKDSGDEDLASKLCCAETKMPLLGDTDVVDDSLVEVVKASSKICVEKDVLWSCYLEVMINKNDNGKEEDMAHSVEEEKDKVEGVNESDDEEQVSQEKEDAGIEPVQSTKEKTTVKRKRKDRVLEESKKKMELLSDGSNQPISLDQIPSQSFQEHYSENRFAKARVPVLGRLRRLLGRQEEAVGLPEPGSSLPPILQDNKPTERQLGRISMKIGNKSVLLGQALGLSEADIQQIQKIYPHTATQCLMICFKWKLQSGDKATFRNLEMAFKHAHIDADILGSVNEAVDRVSCLPSDMLFKQPEDKHLNEICSKIGTEHVHLGVELEVPFSRIEQILTENQVDVHRQCFEILKDWRQRQVGRATFKNLEKAFKCIGIDPDILKKSLK